MHEAKSNLSQLLRLMEDGERVIIARAGRPVAELVPHRRPDIVFGTAAGRLHYDDAAFDDSDDSILRLFGVR